MDGETEVEMVYVIFLGLPRRQLKRMRPEHAVYVSEIHAPSTAALSFWWGGVAEPRNASSPDVLFLGSSLQTVSQTALVCRYFGKDYVCCS